MKEERAKKYVIEKILSIFAWLIFAIAMLTATLSVFSSFSGEKNGKDIFGFKFLIVASDSMSKSVLSENESVYFDAGDVVIIKSTVAGQEYKEGDVISFLSRNPDSYGKTLTHKIREVNYSSSGQVISYTTYGINTGVNDRAVVSPDTIIGEYVGKIPKIGTLFSYLKTPLGYYLSILTPSILLIIFFSIKVGRYLGRKEAIEEMGDTQATDLSTRQEFEELCDRVKILEIILSDRSGLAITAQDLGQDTTQLDDDLMQANDELEQDGLVINGRKISFTERLLGLDESVQEYFNTLHNEMLSYKKITGRISFKHLSYRMGRKLLAKMTVRGKTLKLHLNLNVNDFNENVFFQKDLSNVKAYEEVPFTVKVKSTRAEKNAVKLITALMEENGAVKKNQYELVDMLALLKGGQEEQTAPSQLEEVAEEIGQGKLVINGKKISFAERLLGLDESIRQYFNAIHNKLVSYKRINDRVSYKGISYRIGRKLVAKITVRGKTLKLHLNLNVNDFNKNVFFQKDMSQVKAYEEVPFTVKVKSARAQKNAVKLVDALMEKNQTIINPKYVQINAIDLLKEKLDKNK